MLVMKFGGTSVGTPESLRATCQIIKNVLPQKPFVVVSAHNSPHCRMTDTLVQSAKNALTNPPAPQAVIDLQHWILDGLGLPRDLAADLLTQYAQLLTGINMLGEMSPRTLDAVMSFGERMSCRVVAAVLTKEFGVPAKALTAMELGLRTDGAHGNAQPDENSYHHVRHRVKNEDGVVITTGFIGEGPDGHITTLGRGGSDYSGTIFGAALGASEVQIWTDVNGVMTADPKIAPLARSIPALTFAEAAELAWFGAKVLHPATMLPAMKYNIPVRVLNTQHPDHPGTLITSHSGATDCLCKSIAHRKNVIMLTITSPRMLGMHGFMAQVFAVCDRHELDVHMIATSEVSVSLTTPRHDNIDKVVADLRTFGEVSVERDKSLLCIVGENMAGVPGVASRIVGALAENHINLRMISQGANEINIALLIATADLDRAIAALHRNIFE
ncbi:aspartokinase [Planctomycetales bacterium]|nr:aspartokinase [Planctomycetales bacterium]GHS99668.1 aspartokinase [Planctomycetales bacterium]GHT06648.1 aspartokinase [Planctomycetales bacterium]